VPTFEPYLASHQQRILRRAAALAIGTILGAAISTQVLDILLEGTEDEANAKEDAERLGWSWNDPSLKGCCWRVIHSIGL
jgi:hypothetical protein